MISHCPTSWRSGDITVTRPASPVITEVFTRSANDKHNQNIYIQPTVGQTSNGGVSLVPSSHHSSYSQSEASPFHSMLNESDSNVNFSKDFVITGGPI